MKPRKRAKDNPLSTPLALTLSLSDSTSHLASLEPMRRLSKLICGGLTILFLSLWILSPAVVRWKPPRRAAPGACETKGARKGSAPTPRKFGEWSSISVDVTTY